MFWERNSFTVDSRGQLWMAPYAMWYHCHVTNRSQDGFRTIKMYKPKNSWDFWMAAMFHRCISPDMENIAWVLCWADSTIQKEDQWCGFRTAYKAKLCCSLPSDQFTSHSSSGECLREHLDSGCAVVSFTGSAHGHSSLLGAGYQVQCWCWHCMKQKCKAKHSEAQTWEGFKNYRRGGAMNHTSTHLECQKTRSLRRPRTLQLPSQNLCSVPHQETFAMGAVFLYCNSKMSLTVSKRNVLTSTSPPWLCLLGFHPSTEAFTRTGSLLRAEFSLQKAKSRCSQACYQSKRRQRCRFEGGWIFSLFNSNGIVVRAWLWLHLKQMGTCECRSRKNLTLSKS